MKCKYNGGTLAFGYTIDSDRHYQIDPRTAPVVLETFTRYDNGTTMKEIRDDFNDIGVTTVRDKAAGLNFVAALLHNQKFLGEYKYREIVIPNGILAIEPQDLFDRVRDKLAKNLIHQPFADYYGAWRAMAELYRGGEIRAIGVSNFPADRIIDLCYNADVIPAVNQIELHPFYQREEELEILREYNIQPQAWTPFAEGLNGMFTHPVLASIAETYGRTVAQVILRWNIQRGVSVIPKSVHRERMEENFRVWDFALSNQDMARISELDLGRPQMLDTRKPSEVKRVYGFKDNPVITSLNCTETSPCP